MAHCGGEPFFCFTAKTKPEVSEGCDIIPVFGNLTFVDPEHEFLSSDRILKFFTEELRYLDNFLLQRDIRVGQNLLSELGSRLLGCWVDHDILRHWRVDYSRSASNRLRLIHCRLSMCCKILFWVESRTCSTNVEGKISSEFLLIKSAVS